MNAVNKIDFHHYPFPIQYINAIKKTLGVDFPIWTPETSLKVMDDNGTKKGIFKRNLQK